MMTPGAGGVGTPNDFEMTRGRNIGSKLLSRSQPPVWLSRWRTVICFHCPASYPPPDSAISPAKTPNSFHHPRTPRSWAQSFEQTVRGCKRNLEIHFVIAEGLLFGLLFVRTPKNLTGTRHEMERTRFRHGRLWSS